MEVEMRRMLIPMGVLAVLAAVAIACGSGTSGSVLGSGETCYKTGSSGVCEGTYSKLSGTYGAEIEDDDAIAGDEVAVTVEFSVETGTVRVSLKSPDGDVQSAEAGPGESATVAGVAEGTMDGFNVTFEAVGGEAGGVSYRISYQIP
jgi:hypothetical protein